MLPRLFTSAAAVACLAFAAPAQSIGSLADVQLIDRATGETLPIYWHNGHWWIPGKPGARYSVQVTNRSDTRALAVISVDGVNVVSGETAAHDQTGYVLASGQSAQIAGWRKNLSRVAAFEFTALPNSYAARTGRPDNVGVIGVAVFREKQRPQAARPVARAEASKDAPESAAAPSPKSASGADRAEAQDSAARGRAAPLQESRLGTGHGRIEHSPTSYTEFERAQTTPNEIITLHYDSRDNLIAMGVIPRPRAFPNPFPATAGFVPDPR